MKDRILILSLLSLLLFCVAPNAIAGIAGKGQAKIFNDNTGSARNQAKSNALRDAVEKGVGTILDANTVVKNWVVLQDEVYSSAQGFVSSYTTTRDEQIGDIWFYEIDAEVQTSSIQNKLEELRILHKKMGNKRMMVLYLPQHPNALQEDHNAVLSAISAIQTGFNNSGFRVFDQKSVGHVFGGFNQRGAPSKSMEDWIRIASEQQVDMLVEFELLSTRTKGDARFKYTAAKVNVRMKVHNVSTGRLISNTESTQKQFTTARVGSFDWDNDLSKAGDRAADEATAETITNIVNYYKTVGDLGNSYLIVFKDFVEDEEDTLLEILENMEGFQSQSELKNVPMLLEIEYFSNMEKSRLRRKLRQAAKQKGLRVQSKEIAGNRLVFIKP